MMDLETKKAIRARLRRIANQVNASVDTQNRPVIDTSKPAIGAEPRR